MIKCLIGLEIPDSGSIKVMGEELENSIDIRWTSLQKLDFFSGKRVVWFHDR
jgi:ABC-type multidrug transport system ATPase subunit